LRYGVYLVGVHQPLNSITLEVTLASSLRRTSAI
jgi:hypothetical protein